MPIEAAIAFDRFREFSKFLAEEPVGAVRWLDAVFPSRCRDRRITGIHLCVFSRSTGSRLAVTACCGAGESRQSRVRTDFGFHA